MSHLCAGCGKEVPFQQCACGRTRLLTSVDVCEHLIPLSDFHALPLKAHIDALAARVARLEAALKQAAEDLQLVGDDYPDSSCHKWCSESAATARQALADSAVQK